MRVNHVQQLGEGSPQAEASAEPAQVDGHGENQINAPRTGLAGFLIWLGSFLAVLILATQLGVIDNDRL